jgi:hypothetical protein
MSKLTRKIKEELTELLPPTVFFFVALHIVAFIYALMDERTGINLPTSATVTVAALVIAKSVLLAVLILMYCVMGEFSRVMGRDKIKAIFIGPPARQNRADRTRLREMRFSASQISGSTKSGLP